MSILSKSDVNKRNKGFTLVELVVVLIVISVLSVLAIMAKPKLTNAVSTYQLRTQVGKIIKAVDQERGDTPNYDYTLIESWGNVSTLSVRELCGNGVLIDDNLCVGPYDTEEDHVYTPFGGYMDMHVNIDEEDGLPDGSYSIRLAGASALPVGIAESFKEYGEVTTGIYDPGENNDWLNIKIKPE